jgi:hypothetical protein
MNNNPTPEIRQLQLWSDDEMPPLQEETPPDPNGSQLSEQSSLAHQLYLPGFGPEEDDQQAR